jgi:hypothetical protein
LGLRILASLHPSRSADFLFEADEIVPYLLYLQRRGACQIFPPKWPLAPGNRDRLSRLHRPVSLALNRSGAGSIKLQPPHFLFFNRNARTDSVRLAWKRSL